MAIREIIKMGAPSLLQKARLVTDFGAAELTTLIADLKDTQQHLDGVGIAAPQIGVPLRVILFGFADNERYPDSDPITETVLINPGYEPLTKQRELGWEGCLSVPGLRGAVPRFTHIRYFGYNAKKQRIEREATGFHARVVQHELDHLDGILYVHRIENLALLGYEDALSYELPLDQPTPIEQS